MSWYIIELVIGPKRVKLVGCLIGHRHFISLHHNSLRPSKLDSCFKRGQKILHNLSVSMTHERSRIVARLWSAVCGEMLFESLVYPVHNDV